MKLWDKGKEINIDVDAFTVGKDRELDLQLASHDVLGSMAHAIMLESIGLLTANETKELLKELKNIYLSIEKGGFTIHAGIEDVHSQVEFMLTEKLGETGKKIHSGRSRNDQVLLDLKLFFRSEIKDIIELVNSLFQKFIALSEKHKNVLMPGYTHMQVAMPSSFGLWFGSYAEALTDDVLQFLSTYRIVNQNPLGSGAGYGSSFPLNRTLTTKLLGFDDLSYNVVYAQGGRGKVERSLAFSLSLLASTLGKFAMDSCLFVNQNFGFISFPDELTTGSSIMPHKKNPDVFEILRAKCNRIQALPGMLSQVTGNLTTGYHRDMQLLKEIVFPAIQEINECMGMLMLMLDNMVINPEIVHADIYDYLFSVEEVNRLVMKGLPFRDAYKQVGKQIEQGEFIPQRQVHHTHEGSIGNLCNSKIKEKMNKVLKEFNFDTYLRAIEELIEK